MRMNKGSCNLDHTKEEFEGINWLCKLCKADLTPKTESPNVKVESPEPPEAIGGVSKYPIWLILNTYLDCTEVGLKASGIVKMR
jgi:hypothetical protein